MATNKVSNNTSAQAEPTVEEATKDISRKYVQNYAVSKVTKMLQKATEAQKKV